MKMDKRKIEEFISQWQAQGWIDEDKHITEHDKILMIEDIEALAEPSGDHGGFDNAETEIADKWLRKNHIVWELKNLERTYTSGVSMHEIQKLFNVAKSRINFTQLAEKYQAEFGGNNVDKS